MKILFVCLGNICRSTMAEFMLKHKIKNIKDSDTFYIASAGTSSCEIGSDIHVGTKNILRKYNIEFQKREAVKITKADYENYDYIIYMDSQNKVDLERVVGKDIKGKMYKASYFSNIDKDVADPWYTGNFEETYRDLDKYLDDFLSKIKKA